MFQKVPVLRIFKLISTWKPPDNTSNSSKNWPSVFNRMFRDCHAGFGRVLQAEIFLFVCRALLLSFTFKCLNEMAFGPSVNTGRDKCHSKARSVLLGKRTVEVWNGRRRSVSFSCWLSGRFHWVHKAAERSLRKLKSVVKSLKVCPGCSSLSPWYLAQVFG